MMKKSMAKIMEKLKPKNKRIHFDEENTLKSEAVITNLINDETITNKDSSITRERAHDKFKEGVKYFQEGLWSIALEKFKKVIERFEEIPSHQRKENDDRYLATIFNNIACCYYKIEQYEEAKQYFLLAANSFTKIIEIQMTASNYNRLADYYDKAR